MKTRGKVIMADCEGPCKKFRRVHKNTKTGKLLCPVCCRKDPVASTYDDCSACGGFSFVAGRTDEDEPLCIKCIREAKSLTAPCKKCKQKKTIQALGLCFGCYKERCRKRAKRALRNGLTKIA